MRRDGELGHKLGPRLAAVTTQAIVAARAALAPHEARVRAEGLQIGIDRMGREAADHFAPLLTEALRQENIHPAMAAFLGKAASGKHQWQAAGQFLFQNAGVASALGQAISNAVAPAVYELNHTGPNLAANPQTAAAATASGVVSPGDAMNAATAQGLQPFWFQAMVDLATAIPDIGSLGELVNRGLISEADADYWLSRAAYPARIRAQLLGLRRALLSPADAALAVLRGNISQADADAIAARNGMTAGDLAVLQDNTGEPLGLEQLLEGLRRGFIDDAQLERGIRQSRIRNEWITLARQLRFAPMSTADAVAAVVQNHITSAEGQQIAEQNGLEAAHWATLVQTAGEPLSLTEMTELWRRGDVGQADVEQALRESRLKDKYIPAALNLRTRIPAPREIVTAVERGAATSGEALQALKDYGYTDQIATVLLKSGLAAKRGTVHHLAVGTITRMYEDRLISQPAAHSLLTGLGWSAEDATWALQLADVTAAMKLQAQAVAAIRGRYVARHIPEQVAIAALDDLDIPAAQRTQLIRAWEIEQAVTVRSLTEAQIVKAVKEQLIGATDAAARLEAMGYGADDASILLGVAPGQPLPS